jgi:transposase-like protein
MAMAQHFLLSAKARTFSIAQVIRLSDDEAYAAFRALRWDDGEPVCPRCGCFGAYEYKARRIFRCRECKAQFSVTSGTIFASRKMSYRDLLAAIAIFVNGAKGYSAPQLSRDLNCQYKSAFVLADKLREIMSDGQDGRQISGRVEIDGDYFGGYVKPANRKDDRIDRRTAPKTTFGKSPAGLREGDGSRKAL